MPDFTLPMVEPEYPNWTGPDKIKLKGRVLAFGSGQLVHERQIFDVSEVGSIVAYDPFAVLRSNELQGGWADAEYMGDWHALLAGAPEFDQILCLFSLHYEPQWLKVLCDLVNTLRPKGQIYFCEDRGFRAVLDGNANTNLHDYPGVEQAFKARLGTGVAAPWLPDFSASDASLMREILGLFGVTRALSIYSAPRKVRHEYEPQCYLPWNTQRTGINEELVDDVRRSIPNEETVEEKIALFEFTKNADTAPVSAFDLTDARTSMMWRAVSDRAGRAVGRLIVSRATNEPQARDQPFRRAALALLYQNVLRHFSFWRAAELVVGALNPEIERLRGEAKKDEYDFTCIAPYDNPRYWGAKFEQPAFLRRYVDNLIAKDLSWVGKELYKEERGGVYCWPGAGNTIPEERGWDVIQPVEKELYSKFVERETPPCVYVIDPLATREDMLVSSQNQLLFGAMVIYLQPKPDPALLDELRCLLWVLETSRSIVVGRAGFLEMELLRQDARYSQVIQQPLGTLRTHQKVLREISDAVENLVSSLDPYAMSPGLPALNAIRDSLHDGMFRGDFHYPDQQTLERLIEHLRDDELSTRQHAIVGELKLHGVSEKLADCLFQPMTSKWIAQHPRASAVFAKILSRRGVLPAAWVQAVFDEQMLPDRCGAYLDLPAKSDLNAMNAFMAFVLAKRASRGPDCTQTDSTLDCFWNVYPDSSGARGLRRLHRLITAKKLNEKDAERIGNTSRSFRHLLRLAEPTTLEVNVEESPMRLDVRAQFPLIHEAPSAVTEET